MKLEQTTENSINVIDSKLIGRFMRSEKPDLLIWFYVPEEGIILSSRQLIEITELLIEQNNKDQGYENPVPKA